MPERDRLDLAAALIGSVDKDCIRVNVDAAWVSEARRRLAEVLSRVVKPVPWEEAEEQIFDPPSRPKSG